MMIDIKQVTQVNAKWIFTKNDERFKSTAENVREIYEQAKSKHIMYNSVVTDLSHVYDYVRNTFQYHAFDRWTQDDNRALANEYLYKLHGICISIDYLRALSDRYYKIEIQAHNVMHAKHW